MLPEAAANLSRLSLAGRMHPNRGLILYCNGGDFALPYPVEFVKAKEGRFPGKRQLGTRWKKASMRNLMFDDWMPIGGNVK